MEIIDGLYNELSTNIRSISSKYTEIQGEIISSKYTGNNTYIVLKCGQYNITCIGWSNNYNDGFNTGIIVKITGTISLTKKNLSIYYNIKKMAIVEKGIYMSEFEKIKNTIFENVWTTDKKEIKYFPFSVGICTAFKGAAIQDILNTFHVDKYIGNVFIKDTIVQGRNCAQSVIKSIEYFEKFMPPIDIIMISRGGGSLEDLIGFSDFKLIEKIHNCPNITFSAVGHQIDNQLCDDVSDYKFATPSIGAKFIVEKQQQYYDELNFYKNILTKINDKIMHHKNIFEDISINYISIVKKYDLTKYKKVMTKYTKYIDNILKKISDYKILFKTTYSTIMTEKDTKKITIYKNKQEINSLINLIENTTPKKIEIFFPDGNISIYYKIIKYEFK